MFKEGAKGRCKKVGPMCKGWSRVGLNKMIEFWNGPMEERLMWKAKFGSSLQALHAFNALEEGGYLFDHA